MLTVIESENSFEIQSTLPTGQRVIFLLLALFPLIAPYELIIEPDWEYYFNVFFLIALIISVGAMALSAFLVWAAIAGLNSQLRFDKSQGTFSCAEGAPVVRWQTKQFPLEDVASLRIEKQDWSDGSPSYTLLVVTDDGKEFKAGSSWSLKEMEAIRQRASSFLFYKVEQSHQ